MTVMSCSLLVIDFFLTNHSVHIVNCLAVNVGGKLREDLTETIRTVYLDNHKNRICISHVNRLWLILQKSYFSGRVQMTSDSNVFAFKIAIRTFMYVLLFLMF